MGAKISPQLQAPSVSLASCHSGPKSLMSIQQNMLIEYDPSTRAAVGVVALDMENRKVAEAVICNKILKTVAYQKEL